MEVNEGIPPNGNDPNAISPSELKDYLDQRGAYGGIIKSEHTSQFYKMKYEELNEKHKDSNRAWRKEIKELEEELDLTEFYGLIPWDKDRSMGLDDIKNYITQLSLIKVNII